MKEYICIVCPNGCHLKYDEKTGECSGNKCKRGALYAKNEFTCPKRSVTSSVKTTVEGYPVVSVRTSADIEKRLIPELMEALKNVVINEPLDINSVVIKNVLNTGSDIITTTKMIKGDR